MKVPSKLNNTDHHASYGYVSKTDQQNAYETAAKESDQKIWGNVENDKAYNKGHETEGKERLDSIRCNLHVGDTQERL